MKPGCWTFNPSVNALARSLRLLLPSSKVLRVVAVTNSPSHLTCASRPEESTNSCRWKWAWVSYPVAAEHLVWLDRPVWVAPLEIILSARDFDADEAEALGTINKALDADEIGEYVDNLARRIAQFPAESINACKQAVYESIDKPIDEALKAGSLLALSSNQQNPRH